MNKPILSSIFGVALLISHSGKAKDYQLPFANADLVGGTSLFNRSISSGGIGSFFDIFNMPAYPQEFLPNNFAHFIEFLQQGNKTGKDQLYVRSVIRLFCNKIKSCSYINAYAFSQMLSHLPALLERHFVIKSENVLTSLKEVIYEIQYQSFKEQFPQFKLNPETFLSNLSQQIEDAAELRKLMAVFLDVGLSKLIWTPSDQFETWHSVKTIADQLAVLYKKSIITDLEDLNSLCITLLERYCFFLDVAGPQLEIETFEKIRADMNVCRSPLLDLEEQEKLLETKGQRLARCLIEQEAKARAREQGLVLS